MTTWQDFLLEHAKFPFPPIPNTGEDAPVSLTDISRLEIGNLNQRWKAKYAMQDATLVDKLCQALDMILGDTAIVGPQDWLLSLFGRCLEFVSYGSGEMALSMWSQNTNEAESRRLLGAGVFTAAEVCLQTISRTNGGRFTPEHPATEGRSPIGYVGALGGKPLVLVEVESPAVMKKMEESIPIDGIQLKWGKDGPFAATFFQKVALYLGLRNMEWLFLTSHNHWIVCRLVNDPHNPFLAYSPSISIEDSSVPFRALLGAMLSVYNSVSVPASVLSPGVLGHDGTPEGDQVDGSVAEDDTDDSSGLYVDSGDSTTSTITSDVLMTSSQAVTELMITSSSPHSPKSFQVWVHLQPLPNNEFLLPPFAKDADTKPRLWLTRVIGSGSTGMVWQCRSDECGGLYAIKVVELLCRSDVERLQRFRNEVEVYLALEMAYQSGQLRNRVSPNCYGAFKDEWTNVLVLELCDRTLNSWDELNHSEKTQVYGLILDLHSVGIVHGDLEPQHIARVLGDEFRLIDFSASTRHTCVEFAGESGKRFSKRARCPELQAMRKVLRPDKPYFKASQIVALETQLETTNL